MLATVYSVLFQFLQTSRIIRTNSFFEKSKPRYVAWWGDRSGQGPSPTVRSPKSFSSGLKHLPRRVSPVNTVRRRGMFHVTNTSCVPQFCHHSVYCPIRYVSHCYMLQEQQKMISMRSSVRKQTHVLLVNAHCSRLHSFRANGVKSGLATRGDLDRVSRAEQPNALGQTYFRFNFCTAAPYATVVGQRSKWYSLYISNNLMRISSSRSFPM
jgi:hypothetical protein